MTSSTPPADHLRRQLVNALFLAVEPQMPPGSTWDVEALADALLPAVARALTEARADELEQAASDFAARRDHAATADDMWTWTCARLIAHTRADALRASIRQTDERNDR